jgi:hypothetical protein
MSTSPTFDVLLWGNAWWLPGRSDPIGFAHPVDAAAALAEHIGGRGCNLRLVYEPEGFRTRPTDCPNTDRSTLGWALSERFPELVDPGIGWSFEPIRARGEGYATLLHLETNPGFLSLVQSLAQVGLTVVSAWPAPTWLQMLPDDLGDSGNVVAALVGQNRVCLCHESVDGSRDVERWQGTDALDDFEGWLQDRLVRLPGTAVEIVTSQAERLAKPGFLSGLIDEGRARVTPLADALERNVVIPPQHPGQMLPPAARYSLSRMLSVTSWAALFAVCCWAGMVGWSGFRSHQVDQSNLPTLAALRTEVEQLRSNAKAIERLRLWSESNTPVVASDLLLALATYLPTGMVLERFDARPSQVTIDGWMAPQAAVDSGWVDRLADSDERWRWDLTQMGDGAFRLQAVEG